MLVLHNELEYDHETLLEGKTRPPPDEIEEYITDLFKSGITKVNDVIRSIDFARTKHGLFKSESNPGKRQIEYMLQKFRCAEAPSMINLGDMIDWCTNTSSFQRISIAHSSSAANILVSMKI